jgi:phosphoribosylanthranilate isomerase
MIEQPPTRNPKDRVQIKICGLTQVETALACASLGADAIGCIFYPKSPRHLTDARARDICTALSPEIKTVGVFVNETFKAIMCKVERCGLKGVQLHGREPVELVSRLRKEKLLVVKALFVNREPSIKMISGYHATAYLVECGRGVLPGGNAQTWNWDTAREPARKYPLILAGGLSPENIGKALSAACPDAVDVSSGVESSPGSKDIDRVASFIKAVSRYRSPRKTRRIF